MQLFSYHLIEAPFFQVFPRLLFSGRLRRVPGLLHSECLMPMKMASPVALPTRYQWRKLALFAFWESEEHVDAFMKAPPHAVFERPRWHVRMRYYRQWGSYAELNGATMYPELARPDEPVVAVTLARLRLSQAFRFAKWGKPVEAQVGAQAGMTRAAVAFRPFNTFSTFTMWENEEAMRTMVRGGASVPNDHRDAMIERAKRPFHHEFITMRFVPLSVHGEWPGHQRLLTAS